MTSLTQVEDRGKQMSVADRLVIFNWKSPVFKLNIQGVCELCANYFINKLYNLVVKCHLFQFLTSGMDMESTIRIGGQNVNQ